MIRQYNIGTLPALGRRQIHRLGIPTGPAANAKGTTLFDILSVAPIIALTNTTRPGGLPPSASLHPQPDTHPVNEPNDGSAGPAPSAVTWRRAAPVRVPIRSRLPPRRWTSAPAILLGVFLLLNIVGGLLLVLPAAAADGQSAGFQVAFFTAISASTVTGLTQVDTQTFWSTSGQIILFVLMLIGGPRVHDRRHRVGILRPAHHSNRGGGISRHRWLRPHLQRRQGRAQHCSGLHAGLLHRRGADFLPDADDARHVAGPGRLAIACSCRYRLSTTPASPSCPTPPAATTWTLLGAYPVSRRSHHAHDHPWRAGLAADGGPAQKLAARIRPPAAQPGCICSTSPDSPWTPSWSSS